MVLICQSKWNDKITGRLAKAAIEACQAKGLETKFIQVPGALEIPLAIKWMWAKAQREQTAFYGAVACGCVVKGDTHHFEMVASDSSRMLSELALELRIPIGHAILAVYDYKDALTRSQDSENKGEEAASAVIEMIELAKKEKLI